MKAEAVLPVVDVSVHDPLSFFFFSKEKFKDVHSHVIISKTMFVN